MAGKSSGRLAVNVYAKNEDDEIVWFGPGDDVPGWAAKQITNPDVWESAPKGADAGAAGDGAESDEPPLGGAGSGVAAWRAYAEGLGIADIPEDATRDDIVALVRGQ
jgi:hypothetical protein